MMYVLAEAELIPDNSLMLVPSSVGKLEEDPNNKINKLSMKYTKRVLLYQSITLGR